LRVLTTNFKALNICKLALPSILKKESGYQAFVNAYKSSIIDLVKNGYTKEFE